MTTKGTVYQSEWGRKYQVVGYWDKDIVLAPMASAESQVLIYTDSEITEFIENGSFKEVVLKGEFENG